MECCTFCNPGKDPKQRIMLENETCLFIQKDEAMEVLEGTGLVIPKAHRSNVFELTREEWNDTYELLAEAKRLLDEAHAPDGYTLGWNVGKASNQTIDHAHFHIVPRFNDEPYAGRGLRYWIKQPANKRPSRA